MKEFFGLVPGLRPFSVACFRRPTLTWIRNKAGRFFLTSKALQSQKHLWHFVKLNGWIGAFLSLPPPFLSSRLYSWLWTVNPPPPQKNPHVDRLGVTTGRRLLAGSGSCGLLRFHPQASSCLHGGAWFDINLLSGLRGNGGLSAEPALLGWLTFAPVRWERGPWKNHVMRRFGSSAPRPASLSRRRQRRCCSEMKCWLLSSALNLLGWKAN